MRRIRDELALGRDRALDAVRHLVERLAQRALLGAPFDDRAG